VREGNQRVVVRRHRRGEGEARELGLGDDDVESPAGLSVGVLSVGVARGSVLVLVAFRANDGGVRLVGRLVLLLG
jgi:hypothetical protein